MPYTTTTRRSAPQRLRALVVVLIVALGILGGAAAISAHAAPSSDTSHRAVPHADPIARLGGTLRQQDDLTGRIARHVQVGLETLAAALDCGDSAARLAAGLRVLAATAGAYGDDPETTWAADETVAAAHDEVVELRDEMVAELPADPSPRGPTAALRRRVARADRALASLPRVNSPVRRMRIVIRARRVLVDGR